MDRALLELAARHHLLVPRREVSRAGISPTQWRRVVASGEWVEAAPDVFRHALTPDSWRLRARAGLLYLGEHAALHGTTAAAWWGLEVPEPTVVEFLVPRGRRGLTNSLRIHTTEQWESRDLLRRDDVRLVSVTRAIIDAAGDGVSASTLESMIDSGIASRRTSMPTLGTRMAELAGPGRHGIPLLRALLLDSGGESYLERAFLKLTRRHGLPRPSCQVVHRTPGGRVVRVDFQFPGTNIVVEVSGRLGHTSDRDRQRDARRRNALQHDGWQVIEFTTADVLDDVPYVLATLRASLASAVSPPGAA